MRPRTAALLVAAFVIFSPIGLASDVSGARPAGSPGPGAGDEGPTVASAEKLKDAGRFEDAMKILEEALTTAVEPEVRRQFLAELGEVQFAWAEDLERQYKLKEAIQRYEQALPIERAVGDRRVEAATLNNIGLVYSALGKKRKALEYYEQALPIRRAVGDRAGEAETLHNIGRVYSALGKKRKALEFYEQVLPIERAVGDRRGEAATVRNTMYSWEALARPRVAILFGKQSVNVYQQLRTALQGLDPELQKT